MDKILSITPGRTCLFGDHQDDLGLPIIACAINKHITLQATKNNSDYFFLDKHDMNINRKIYVKDKIILPKKPDFFLTTLQVLKRYGCIPNCGYDIKITVQKIDAMIDTAHYSRTFGAKIVGSGGGGGSFVVLSNKENEQQILDAILAAGAKDAYAVNVKKDANVHFVTHFYN